MMRIAWLFLLTSGAWAGVDCNAPAVTALSVPGVTIQVADRVAAAGANPEYCRVAGTVVTTGEGAPDGLARFDVRLPANWSGKFLFYGVGGLAGALPPQYDSEGGLAKGYAVAVTDGGHNGGNTDARFALTGEGQPDRAKVIDYYYRAAHSATLAAKQIVEKYYSTGRIQRAYFNGCSNGGRMALQEAERYPDDFDGIIAGAPFMTIRAVLMQIKLQKSAVPASYITPAQLEAVDRSIYASCDRIDGVQDGLIVNPGLCTFDPQVLACKPGATGSDCLTQEQAEFLRRSLEPLRDSRGRVLVPGFAITDMAGRGGVGPWTTGMTPPDRKNPDLWATNGPLGWQFASHILQYLVQYAPKYESLKFDVSPAGVVGDAALKLWDERTGAGSVDDPAKLLPFLSKGKKLLLYHGWSDPALSPYKTVLFYEQLAGLRGTRYNELQKNARLFMVPGMQHCGGGPGPNSFDLLSAIDNWVSKDEAPDAIVATKYTNDQRSAAAVRTMPLCKFPEVPRYKGSGDRSTGANWDCSGKSELLQTGPSGLAAGLPRNGRPAR